jgi:CRISPR-associated protein Csb2
VKFSLWGGSGVLAIEVEFLMGRAVATDIHERNEPEWPPHPQRLFSALVATQSDLELGSSGHAALEWLESLPAPEIRAELSPSRRQVHSHWVPVNDEAIKVERGRVDFRHPLDRRTRQERFFPAVVPEEPIVVFQWCDAMGVDSHKAALSRLVENLSYFGHSSSPVRACLRSESVEPTLKPSPDGEHVLRVPGPGRLRRLEAVHKLRQRDESIQPPIGRLQNYTQTIPRAHTVFSRHALTLAFETGPRLSLDSTLPLMLHLRNAILSRLGVPAPASLSGHDSSGLPAKDPHLAFAPLAFVNAKFADGSLKGATLVLPREAEQSMRRQLAPALDGRWELHLGPLGAISIRVVENPWEELQSLRFQPYARAYERWATVTPIVLDRHPKKNRLDAGAIIARSCERIGLPAPLDVSVGPISAISGVPAALDFHGRSKQTDGRMRVHAVLRFANSVYGPLLLGAGRFIGLGLCLPFEE